VINAKTPTPPEILGVGFTLTVVAGFVDAVGFLTLGQIYVANMSGNTVAVAIHLSDRHWGQAWSHVCPLLAFVPGLVAGGLVVALCKRFGRRSCLAPAVLIEAVGLAVFLVIARGAPSPAPVTATIGGPIRYAVLVGLLAFSMGLQNGALRRIGALQDLHTYVTGTLLATAHGFTDYLMWVGRWLRRPLRARLVRLIKASRHQRSLRSAAVAGSLWSVYIISALAGAAARTRFGVGTLWIPLVALAVIGIVDLVKPVRRA
jgi:uncharacterized membrane protein YoaK (UPF0700 family)